MANYNGQVAQQSNLASAEDLMSKQFHSPTTKQMFSSVRKMVIPIMFGAPGRLMKHNLCKSSTHSTERSAADGKFSDDDY